MVARTRSQDPLQNHPDRLTRNRGDVDRMELHRGSKSGLLPDSYKQDHFIVGALVAACLIGTRLVTAAGGANTQIIAFGALVIVGFCGAVAYVLDLPLIRLICSAFIASFFFKSDMSVFKIDEMEDPSGLNLSVTVLL